jgi:F420-dependent oxidoreductase-like protein
MGLLEGEPSLQNGWYARLPRNLRLRKLAACATLEGPRGRFDSEIMTRLGLYLGRLPGFDKAGYDGRELIDCVRAADACGYDSFWMPEVWEHEVFSILTQIAMRTERIGLGTGVINIFSRSPALIAMSAATLDEISGGRLRLGLGTSGARVIQDFHGMPYVKPLSRLRETITIVRMLLAGEQADFNGEHFRLSRFKLGFKPLRPQIPIYVASLGTRALGQLGETADGWLPVHWPLDKLSQGIEEIRRGADRTGRDPSAIEIAPMVNCVVSEDRDRARRAARLPLAYYVGGMGDYYHEMLSRLGFGDEANRIQKAWSAGRPKEAIRAVSDEMLDRIAICGPLEVCRAQLEEMPAHRASLTIVPIPKDGTTADKIRIIEGLIQ